MLATPIGGLMRRRAPHKNRHQCQQMMAVADPQGQRGPPAQVLKKIANQQIGVVLGSNQPVFLQTRRGEGGQQVFPAHPGPGQERRLHAQQQHPGAALGGQARSFLRAQENVIIGMQDIAPVGYQGYQPPFQGKQQARVSFPCCLTGYLRHNVHFMQGKG